MKDKWNLPVPDSWVNTNGYGFLDKTPWGLHPGFDFNSPEGGFSDLGKPIHACADGVVDAVIEQNSGFGNHIFIKHEANEETLYSHYAHLQMLQVAEGDVVEMGQQIGTCGNTGLSTASHLHFEIRKPIGKGYEFWPSGWSAEQITKYYFDPVDFIRKKETQDTEMTEQEVRDLINEQIEGKADKNDVHPMLAELENSIQELEHTFDDHLKLAKEQWKATDNILKAHLDTMNDMKVEIKSLRKALKESGSSSGEGVSDEVEVKSFWANLPKEIKVSIYVIGSALIGEAVKVLSGLNLDSVILTGLINVFIVFLVEMRKRIEVRRK